MEKMSNFSGCQHLKCDLGRNRGPNRVYNRIKKRNIAVRDFIKSGQSIFDKE